MQRSEQRGSDSRRSTISCLEWLRRGHLDGRAALGAAAVLLALHTGSASAATVPAPLRAAAAAQPAATFDVIVQAGPSSRSRGVASRAVQAVRGAGAVTPRLERRYAVIDAVRTRLTGAEVTNLARRADVTAITTDGRAAPTGRFSNSQIWPNVSQATDLWNSTLKPPTIAVVDSGVDADPTNFGRNVAAQVDFTSSGPNSPGDGYGHGTFVAGLAAGRAAGYAGGAPDAGIVSLDVFDDEGRGTVGDVIGAVDWIYRNKDAYGIRVANLSLTGSTDASFTTDPLDRAVERLWLSGVVVVAAAGNYGSGGQPSGVRYAPGNDPFVLTVGAVDTAGTVPSNDDVAAPWSAYGHTPDGFAKPELGAPGRHLNGPVPPSASLYGHYGERVVAPGYMYFSGTSFAAPIVAAAAAQVLASHPEWTPDQVKGALMVSAQPGQTGNSFRFGVGVVKAGRAADVANPPNPNAALNAFLVPDPTGGGARVFDAASWSSAARSNASWSSASWSSASWSSASWSSASWSSASWSSASWSSASWSSGFSPLGDTLPARSGPVD